MSYVTGGNQLYSFATANIAATANEDRNSVVINQLGVLSVSDSVIEGDFSAFSVFDGHNGVSCCSALPSFLENNKCFQIFFLDICLKYVREAVTLSCWYGLQ